jgi:MYXO-CTERM domain-containing protein
VRTSATSSSDQDLSSFSSRGWTADGRVKPDIVAPGCTVSAGNDSRIDSNNCGEDTGCGTSYAAPILVGAAALARQYFTEGFYPSGDRSAADARTPSAALLKAMLLNGALPLTGRDNAGMAISALPSNEQGWGRLQLDRTLLFAGATRQLYVDDHVQGFAAGGDDSVRYEIKGLSADEPLKVTLVWTDFPGMPDSPPRAPNVNDVAALNAPRLVNDLDLTVQTGAVSYLGNVLTSGKSSSGGQADRRNNVEQALLTASGDVSIVVRAANVAQETQDYALVVTGRWQHIAPADAMVNTPMDAGGSAALPTADAGGTRRSDGGPTITQTVSDPVVGSAVPEGDATSSGVGSSGGGQAAPTRAQEDAAGCECSVAAHGPKGELLPWLALVFALRGRRRRKAASATVRPKDTSEITKTEYAINRRSRCSR